MTPNQNMSELDLAILNDRLNAPDPMRIERIKTFLRMRYGRELSDVHDDMEFLIGKLDEKNT